MVKGATSDEKKHMMKDFKGEVEKKMYECELLEVATAGASNTSTSKDIETFQVKCEVFGPRGAQDQHFNKQDRR